MCIYLRTTWTCSTSLLSLSGSVQRRIKEPDPVRYRARPSQSLLKRIQARQAKATEEERKVKELADEVEKFGSDAGCLGRNSVDSKGVDGGRGGQWSIIVLAIL